MLCSGADLSATLADRLLSMGGELWTLYGFPETGIWSSVLRLRKRSATTSIGEPIANTALYVLDANLRPAPVGATGIVYVGGDGVGNASATVTPDPMGLAQRAQLFRTGDLGRLRADGQIEYLGRVDDQFSYLGSRVDPAKIERVLLCDPRIAQAAVVHRDEPGPGGSIAAYVVCRPGPAPDHASLVAELGTSLRTSLSHDLWPASIQVREALPQFGNGQIDRRSLSMTRALAPAQESSRISGEIEQELAKIWAAMLGLETIGATDNFFESGGHSLLAARMLTQIERVFGRRIRLATLFGSPTIRELAKILSEVDPREFDFRQLVKIQPYGSRPPLIGINNTGVFYGLAKCLGPDQPVVSLQLFDPSVSPEAMPETLEDIAARYVELIGRVQPQGPYELMGWCVAGSLAFEIARQLKECSKEVDNLFLIDSWVPRYFARQSPLRRLIGGYSLRWQLILADWRKVVAGEQSFSAFLSNRMVVRNRRHLLGRIGLLKMPHGDAPKREDTLETYDQWLLGYLQTITARYEPRRFPIRITLLRSREEPTGWFFQRDAGWAAFTSEALELVFVDGNHFTMFKQPGVAEMARHIARSIDRTVARTVSAGVSSGS